MVREEQNITLPHLFGGRVKVGDRGEEAEMGETSVFVSETNI